MGLQQALYRELAPEARSSGLSGTNRAIVFLVLLSFLFLALETEPTLESDPGWARVFLLFNWIVVIIFAVEYVARVWVAGVNPRFSGLRGRWHYVRQFHSVADLVAFLPELLVMLFAGSSGLIVLRVLRLARLIKLARFVPAFETLGAALRRSGTQLMTSLALALALVYVSAVVLYFAEGLGGEQQASFASIPRSIWWAIATLTTVGYGDVYPVTPLGRIFASVIAVAGVGVVALPAGIFASAFTDELRERERVRLEAELAESRRPGEERE